MSARAAEMPWWKEPTRQQWASFMAAWAGWVLDAFDFTIFLLVMPLISKEFGVSYTATGGSIALTLLVRLVGGVAAGWAADRWGRKLPLMLSMIWFAVFDGLVALAPSFAWVLVLRTLFGFGMGAEWTSGATLAMENWPKRSQGIASGLLQGSWAIGYLMAAGAAAVVVPVFGWRGLFVLAAFPALLALPVRFFVPESPEWKQRAAAAKLSAVKQVSLFKVPGLMSRLLWASLLMAGGFGIYYGLTGMHSAFLSKQFQLNPVAIFKIAAAFNVGMLVGSVACGYLAGQRGVRVAITLFTSGMLLVLPLFIGVWPSQLMLGAALGGALGAGISGTTPMLLTGMFPAELRARCVGFVYHAGAFGAAFVPMGIAFISEQRGLPLSTVVGIAVGASGVILLSTLWIGSRLKTVETSTGEAAPPEVAVSHS